MNIFLPMQWASLYLFNLLLWLLAYSVLLQNYIARFGHGSAKLARQAQSKEKTLQKMMASGLTERVVNDKVGSDM